MRAFCIFYFNFNIMKSEPNLPPDLFPVKGLQEADEHVIFHASWGKNLSCILKKNKSSEEEKSLSCIHQFFCILGIKFSDFCLVSHSDKKTCWLKTQKRGISFVKNSKDYLERELLTFNKLFVINLSAAVSIESVKEGRRPCLGHFDHILSK